MVVLKGVGIGLADILPGMSAGTAALVFGLYDWMVRSIRSFRFAALWPVLVGVAAGILVGARAITELLDAAPGVILAFLLGLVVASAAWVLRRAGPLNPTKLFVGLVALSAAWILSPAPVSAALPTETSLFAVFVSGILAAAAMVLPGISGSSMMIILGQYDRMLAALIEWNWLLLGTFTVGAVVGMVGFAQIITLLLSHFRNITMIALSGLMLGAARALFPAELGFAELGSLILGVLLVGVFRERRPDGGLQDE